MVGNNRPQGRGKAFELYQCWRARITPEQPIYDSPTSFWVCKDTNGHVHSGAGHGSDHFPVSLGMDYLYMIHPSEIWIVLEFQKTFKAMCIFSSKKVHYKRR